MTTPTNQPTAHTFHPHPDLEVTLSEAGSGRTILILHGGGGPFTVDSLAQYLANHSINPMHTLTPTHPGWNGTPRPDWFCGIDDLALTYLQYLEDRKLSNVVVIGTSIGGWIASEMALRDNASRITNLILIDPVGVQVDGAEIRDFFSLDPRGVAEYAYHDAQRFYFDPATLPPEQLSRQKANVATLRIFAGEHMYDPKLLRRLKRVKVPTLIIWGESDRIVTPNYGIGYAAAFPNARLEVIKEAGHLPHIEQPAAVSALIDGFLI